MATAAATAITMPMMVRWSAVRPVLLMSDPTGRNRRSMSLFHRPSSIAPPVRSAPTRGACVVRIPVRPLPSACVAAPRAGGARLGSVSPSGVGRHRTWQRVGPGGAGEGLDAGLLASEDPQHRPGRPRPGGQDQPGGGLVAAGRCHHPPGPGRGRHDGVGPRAGGGQAPDVAVAGPGPARVRELQDQRPRHPRSRRLHRRCPRRPAGRRLGRVRRQRRRGHRGADRGGVADRRRRPCPPHGVHQQTRLGPG